MLWTVFFLPARNEICPRELRMVLKRTVLLELFMPIISLSPSQLTSRLYSTTLKVSWASATAPQQPSEMVSQPLPPQGARS